MLLNSNNKIDRLKYHFLTVVALIIFSSTMSTLL